MTAFNASTSDTGGGTDAVARATAAARVSTDVAWGQDTLVNLAPNPSAEVNTSLWAARAQNNAAFISVVPPVTPPAGTNAFQLKRNTDAAGPAAIYMRMFTGQFIPVIAGDVLSIGCWFLSETTSRQLRMTAFFYDINNVQVGSTVTCNTVTSTTTSWQQSTKTNIPVPVNAVWFELRPGSVNSDIAEGEAHYCDAVIAVHGPTLPAYFDGSFPNASWQGTAGLSKSTLNTVARATTTVRPSSDAGRGAEGAITNSVINPRGRVNLSGYQKFISGGSTPTAVSRTDDGPSDLPFLECAEVTGSTATATNVTLLPYFQNVLSLAAIVDSVAVRVWIKPMSSPGVVTTLRIGIRIENSAGSFLTSLNTTTVANPNMGQWYGLSVKATRAAIIAAAATADRIGIEAYMVTATNAAGTHVMRVAGYLMSTVSANEPIPSYFDGGMAPAQWAGTAHASASFSPAMGRVLSAARPSSDTSGGTEVPTRQAGFGRAKTEAVNGQDVLTRSAGTSRIINDVSAGSDSYVIRRAYLRSDINSVGGTDLLARRAAYARASLDLALTDDEVADLKRAFLFWHLQPTSTGHINDPSNSHFNPSGPGHILRG